MTDDVDSADLNSFEHRHVARVRERLADRMSRTETPPADEPAVTAVHEHVSTLPRRRATD